MSQTEIIFKSEDSLWRQLATGERTFDFRRNDPADPRIQRLRRKPMTSHVWFLNKATEQMLRLPFKGIRILSGTNRKWVMLRLGEYATVFGNTLIVDQANNP